MKTFLIWLVTQAIFARVLFGMVIAAIVELKVPFEHYFSLMSLTVLICIAEVIVSGVVAYPLVTYREKSLEQLKAEESFWRARNGLSR